MPKILEYFGMIFYFYSNEHLPIQIHVSNNEFESIFEILFTNGVLKDIKVRNASGKKPLPVQQLKEANKIISIFAEDIVNRWTDFFVLRKKVKSIKITKRL